MNLATAADWLPDLFAFLWDELQPHAGDILSAGHEQQHYAEMSPLMDAIRRAPDGRAPMALMSYLQGGALTGVSCDVPSTAKVQRFLVVAMCIDSAFHALRPGQCLPARRLPRALAAVKDHALGTGGHYNRAAAGLLLPRTPLSPFATPLSDPGCERPVQSGDRTDRLFRYLTRVNPLQWDRFELSFATLPARDDFHADELKSLRIAVAPWAETASAADFTGIWQGTKPLLRCSVRDSTRVDLEERARALVEALNAAGVGLVLLPELVVSPEAVLALAKALRAHAAIGGALRMVIAGTGMSRSTHAETGLGFNECTVLGARGQILWSQRKLNHYAMSTDAMRRYGLDSAILKADVDHSEEAHTGCRVELRDGRLGRMVILICEDLAQSQPRDHVLDHCRPDWVFTPVLDGELVTGRWIHQKAWRDADEFGPNALIGTSLVLPQRAAPGKPRYAVGLAVPGGAARHYRLLEVDSGAVGPLFAVTDWQPDAWPLATIG